ncbi:MAG: YezD family protein [Candidatus Omnitrophica bacterium]|nr:YezD family protein [Candidatus Omnitrophota bacterium]
MMAPTTVPPRILSQIMDAIASIRYGSVQIMIQDARIVQIEKAEKIRPTLSADLTPGGLSDTPGHTDRTTGGSPAPSGP